MSSICSVDVINPVASLHGPILNAPDLPTVCDSCGCNLLYRGEKDSRQGIQSQFELVLLWAQGACGVALCFI